MTVHITTAHLAAVAAVTFFVTLLWLLAALACVAGEDNWHRWRER